MSGLEDSLFKLKFTSKQLKRQSTRAAKDIEIEKKKIKKAIQEGHDEIARIHAQSATRKQSERLNLLKLSSRVDAVASRVQTAVTMRQLTGNMGIIVKGMDKALESINPERISMLMDKFEEQFEDLDASTAYYDQTTSSASAIDTPQDDVDLLLQKVADEAGLELQQNLPQSSTAANRIPAEQVEDALNERLRALRG